MRKWPGVRADLSAIAEEGLATAQNVSYKVGGEARRRPGLDGDTRISDSEDLITEWTDFYGTPYLVGQQSGVLTTIKISDGTQTTVASGLNSNIRGCFARSNGRLYFTNDFNAMQRVSEGALAAGVAGISPPSAAIGSPTTATGLVTSGVHGLRYRYFDSKSLYMSDPSDQLDLTTTGAGTTLTFSITASGGGGTIIRSTDAKVDQVIIEMTDAGSSAFYRAATVNQVLTGTTISMTDTTLRLQVAAKRDGDFGHQPPPLCSMIAEHRGRIFGLGSTVVTLTGVTVSTASSSTFTTTGNVMSSGWAGRLFKVGGNDKIYRISAMSGNALGVLSEVYTGTAGVATGVTFFSATPDMLYWTRAGFPEAWNLQTFARRVMQNTSDVPSGLISHHEVLHLLGQRTMKMLDYTSDPANGQLIDVPTNMGLWNQRCIVMCNGRIYGWGRSGAWTVNGLIPQHLSIEIDDLIDGSDSTSANNFDVSQFEEFHGAYDPRERRINWFYCTTADTHPKHAISYDIDNGQWSIGVWKQGIIASTLVTGGTSNATRSLVCDDSGFSWYLKADVFDGVPASMSGGVVTVSTTGATTTVIPVTEALPTGTTDLAGVVAVYSGQQSVILSNTATAITLTTALTAAPTIGTELFLGEIDLTIKTKFTGFDGLDKLKRPNYLMIALIPGTSSGKLMVKIYLDHSTSPFVFTKGNADTSPDGVTITNNSASVTVDLDGGNGAGVAFVPLPDSWNRVIAAEIINTRPVNIFKLVDYQWVFKDARGSIAAEGG